jgi:hypothetical protein
MNKILFRGRPAPKNLLNKGTKLLFKSREDNEYEFFLDPKLDIDAVFAKLVLFRTDFGTLEFSDGYHFSIDVEFYQVIGPDNKPIVEQSINSYINKYALIYFNGYAVIEAIFMD